MTSNRTRTRLLDEVHEMATDLHSAALIDKRRMEEFDALCHLGVPDMSPAQIRALRARANVSQAVFAAILNTSVSTIQKWEVGDKSPSGPSLKLLDLLARKGLEALL